MLLHIALKVKLAEAERSSPVVFLGKVILNVCSKCTGEHPYWSVISIKLQSNIFRTPFHKNTSGGLLLQKGTSYTFQFNDCKSSLQFFTSVLNSTLILHACWSKSFRARSLLFILCEKYLQRFIWHWLFFIDTYNFSVA